LKSKHFLFAWFPIFHRIVFVQTTCFTGAGLDSGVLHRTSTGWSLRDGKCNTESPSRKRDQLADISVRLRRRITERTTCADADAQFHPGYGQKCEPDRGPEPADEGGWNV
jgi:hypothetical protein